MSAILLSNPFVALQPPPHTSSPPDAAQTIQAIAPTKAGSDASTAGYQQGQRGTESGYPRQKGSSEFSQPSDATRNSVVSAQVQAQSDARNTTQEENADFDMPDPLPTSPFLIAMREGR